MKLPCIAIIGRPNVGKSSYMNAVAGRRVSIVEPTPGVTRDRVAVRVERMQRSFELIDTGGIGVNDEQRLDDHIERQINIALDLADVVIFLVDGRDGPTPLDQRVATILRKLDKPVVLGVNKIDSPSKDAAAYEFFILGLGDPLPISAQQGIGVFDLLDHAMALLPGEPVEPDNNPDSLVKIAVVGKRNAGKSTFMNKLFGEERVIVSDIPGTTRDSVDVEVDFAGRRFILIDTAGMQRKARVKDSIEFYSQVRTYDAIKRADVSIFMIDALTDISIVDKKLGETILYEKKPCIIVVNKWDLAKGNMTTEDYAKYLADRLRGLHFAPITFISALEGSNLKSVINIAFDLARQSQTKVGTGELNRLLESAFEKRHPPGRSGHKAKIYYGTQVGTSPPEFRLFVNDTALFSDDYKRYLENEIRAKFDCGEVPILVTFWRRESRFHD
jgi:GTP-binding protein